MANAIRDHLEFLRQAKEELAEVNATAAAVKELYLSVMNLERDLENEKRAQSDLLETTIKGARPDPEGERPAYEGDRGREEGPQ